MATSFRSIESSAGIISVVSIDDHVLISTAIEALINQAPDINLVAQGSCGDDVIKLVKDHHPQVLILDLGMPQHSGRRVPRFQALPIIAQIAKFEYKPAIIILSQHFSPAIMQGALEMGVQGYYLKDDSLSGELLQAIRLVSRGGVAFSETVGQQYFGQGQAWQEQVSLTERQIAILAAIYANPEASYAEHARSFGITQNTFKTHLSNIFRALDVNNTTAAIIKALRLGIIEHF